jgi:hypothetical protein
LSKTILQANVYNIRGQKISSFKNNNSFDVSNYKTGVYFLNITLENGQKQTLKFLKN